ncbi:GTP-binding protein Di-Ras1-like [Clytia hemisphaerica]|uniref:Uncharacterized protein n=1 Tax=Clytia hemisphaerica TaxID=252671 RepID=A0A7M5X147_9CNID
MSRKTSVGSWGICLQVAFLGGQGTGKASLIHQVVGHGFVQYGAKENIQDCINKTLPLPGMPNAVIMNTCDLHSFPPMKRVAIQRANIFVLVFAVDDEKSIVEVENYYNAIMELKRECNDYHNNRVPIIVVGNKSEGDGERKFDVEQFIYKMEQEWQCRYIEVSAKYGWNINKLKNMIIEETRLSYNVPLAPPTSSRKKKNSIAGRFKLLMS